MLLLRLSLHSSQTFVRGDTPDSVYVSALSPSTELYILLDLSLYLSRRSHAIEPCRYVYDEYMHTYRTECLHFLYHLLPLQEISAKTTICEHSSIEEERTLVKKLRSIHHQHMLIVVRLLIGINAIYVGVGSTRRGTKSSKESPGYLVLVVFSLLLFYLHVEAF